MQQLTCDLRRNSHYMVKLPAYFLRLYADDSNYKTYRYHDSSVVVDVRAV